VQQRWFEICLYLHISNALVIVVVAVAARFDVFRYCIPGWSLYLLDNLRERTFHTFSTSLIIADRDPQRKLRGEQGIRVYTNSVNNQPTTLLVQLHLPPKFTPRAGQWVYVKVPSVDNVWHPFSVASGSADEVMEFLIGIRAGAGHWSLQQVEQYGDEEWVQAGVQTWTYQLYRLAVRHLAKGTGTLPAQIRGAYGSAFDMCFQSRFSAAIVIGAGTGLTAALSALREMFHLRRRQLPMPQLVWFVWACPRVDDLLWFWSVLVELLLGALHDGTLRPQAKWNANSKVLDWLGFTVYVTRSDAALMSQFLHETEPRSRTWSISEEHSDCGHSTGSRGRSFDPNTVRLDLRCLLHKWMTHDKRLLESAIDGKAAHISKLMRFVRDEAVAGGEEGARTCISFCGPSNLAHVIGDCAKRSGSAFEFSADSQ
jgi:hypothetical protein